MKITATQKFEAEISEAEANRIAIKCIRESIGLRPDHFVHNGKLYFTKTMNTSNSWTEEILVGDATPDELAAQRVINQILHKQKIG